ncbi:hypothetical protein LJ656_22075 [Paraburkholderia sp. MMS20-SJTR3]|uniref:Uncharacterized protein n=1 Tax=Paraburkholderia sejongensis TaxID=2886946 RepID=A0ABS8JZF2_9BURK|nr:hypothetical protein [Paraburkholderia sp. MMS20-SJTR3]MCC8395279.1 hypothetical protein [Paraburkholderia sp. MMS20-SJTR3]
MKQLIRKPAVAHAAALPGASASPAAVGATAHSYRRYVTASRARFFAQSAASSVDLLALVVADALRRKTEAELRHELLRDALYEMPPRRPRDEDGGAHGLRDAGNAAAADADSGD